MRRRTSSSTPRAPSELWFPSGKLYVAGDGTIVSPLGLGSGSVYTVDSQVSTATPAQLRAADSPFALPADVQQQAEQLPHAYPRVLALARSVTAHDTNTYDKVESLIHWIGAHTHYSENIPPLPAGADTVDEFLFGNRVGFCEQISTSLAVMLRSLGIPAREAVGYVPGGYDPITDLYQVHADDAHAWVQVWFPGYGWQNFDPTAVVPLSHPEPRCDRAARRRLGPAAACRRCRWSCSWWSRAGRRSWCAGAGHGRRPGRERVARWPSAPAAGRAGPVGRPRPWPRTRPGSTSRPDRRVDLEPPGLRRSRPARYGGHDPPRRGAARHGRRGQADAGRGRGAAGRAPTRPTARARECRCPWASRQAGGHVGG